MQCKKQTKRNIFFNWVDYIERKIVDVDPHARTLIIQHDSMTSKSLSYIKTN